MARARSAWAQRPTTSPRRRSASGSSTTADVVPGRPRCLGERRPNLPDRVSMTPVRLLALILLPLLLLPWPLRAAEWSPRPLAQIAVYPEFRAPAAELSARIVAMPARVGASIRRGTELVRLDDASFRIELERVRAQIALIDSRIRLARAQLTQSRALAARGFISADGLRIRETEVGVLQSERDAVRAAQAAAELALARTVIRAPYDGVVRERLAAVGDLAAPGTPLLVLAASADA